MAAAINGNGMEWNEMFMGMNVYEAMWIVFLCCADVNLVSCLRKGRKFSGTILIQEKH